MMRAQAMAHLYPFDSSETGWTRLKYLMSLAQAV